MRKKSVKFLICKFCKKSKFEKVKKCKKCIFFDKGLIFGLYMLKKQRFLQNELLDKLGEN